jgi:hypothetical protein
MRFPSRLNSRAGQFARGFALVAFGVVVLAAGSCDDKHIGRPCQTGVPPADIGTSGGSFATITSPVLECPSRICLLPADMNNGGVNHDGATCTAPCSTDDDCSDAETGNASDPGDTRCKTGFLCAWPTTAGPFCCQKMCVCHDFVNIPMGGFQLPAACMAPSTCQNVH